MKFTVFAQTEMIDAIAVTQLVANSAQLRAALPVSGLRWISADEIALPDAV
jgi:hypothetical protein